MKPFINLGIEFLGKPPENNFKNGENVSLWLLFEFGLSIIFACVILDKNEKNEKIYKKKSYTKWLKKNVLEESVELIKIQIKVLKLYYML